MTRRLSRILGSILAVATLCAAAIAPGALRAATPSALAMIGFMTDFDLKDDAVAICKAVMDTIAPGVRILDITHTVEPYNVAQAARFLAGTAPYLPKDSVFVVVVDPGVGPTRRAIIARSRRGQYFVLPDNGLLTLVQDQDGLTGARQVTNPAWMIGAKTSSTFHGRDIFSPAGAHLARGDNWEEAGPAVDVAKLVRLELHDAVLTDKGVEAKAIGTDGPYGNLILNLPTDTFAKLGYGLGESVPMTVGAKAYAFKFVRTFSDVPVGQTLFYVDPRGRLSLGINQGNFAESYHVGEGAVVVIPRKPAG